MAITAEAKVTLRGGPESLRALQGIKRGTNEAGKAAKSAADQQVAAAKKAAEEQRKGSEKAARAAEKSGKDIERVAQREADRWAKLAQKSADVRIKAQEAVTRAAQREGARQADIASKTAAAEVKARRDVIRKMGGFVGAATAGVLAGGLVAANTARGIAGVKDVRERITSANEFRERLFIATGQAGMNAQQRGAVQGQVLGASQATGKDVGELMSVLETGQAQFNNLQFFADNLKEIATISKAAGADTGEFATALGFVKQAFGLSGDEAMETAYLMKAAADKGSVELKDFARDFASSAGIFAMNTKQGGIGGVRQFLGTAQGVATGGFGSAESATRVERFITDLNDIGVQKGLGKIGIKNVADKSGKIDVGSLLEKLSTNKQFSKASVRQGIFKDIRGLQAVESLMAARGRVQGGVAGAVDLKSISGVDADAGRTAVDDMMKSMQGEGFFEMQKEAAKMQAETITNLKGYNDQILAVAKASDSLESSFGRLSLWANSIAAMGIVGAGTSMLSKLGGGGAAATGGGALAKALPTLARGGGAVLGAGSAALGAGSAAITGAGIATAGGLAAVGGVALVGGAVGGAIGYGANKLSEGLTGKSVSDHLADAIFELVHGNRTLVEEARQTNRKLESIDLGQRTNKPAPNQARGPR